MGAPTKLRAAQRLQTVLSPSPVGGLNSVSPFASMDPTEAITMTNIMPSAYGARTRLGSLLWAQHIGSVQANGTFTPPTSNAGGTATFVVGGNSVNIPFNTSAAQTITDLKTTLAGNSAINALISYTGTTTLVCTAKQPGALGNAVTTTTNGLNGAAWGTGTLTGGVTNDFEVRSILAYSGTTSANDRLFVACPDGIYDASVTNVAATKVVSFGSSVGLSGYCTSASFTTVGGNFFVVCDEVNGPYVWDETGAAWHQVTNGAGAWQVLDAAGADATIPASFTSVMTWQNRLWFTQRNSGRGWFLGTGLLPNATTATAQQFGVNMPRGGELRCLKNWTVDGGAGVENNLAAISSAGDISVYTGTDPTTVGKFTLVGTWSFAGLPSGRRIAIDNGGDVLILTAFGLISLSKLLQGASVADRTIYETRKIDNTISSEVTTNNANLNWAVQLSPDESAVLLSCPQGDGSIVQYAMNYQTKGWCKITGRNAHSMGVYQNHLWFGNGAGSVFKCQGGLDEVGFAGGGAAIVFTYFSSFQGLSAPTQNKRVQLVRPMFLTGGSDTNWTSLVRYDYDLSQIVSAPASNPGASSLWDVATWDSSIWGGDLTRDYALNGVLGMGRVVAIFLIGICSTTTVLNSIDVMYETGGYL
jgi:hypothetical protein